MTVDQAIEWMHRNCFYNTSEIPQVMQKLSFAHFPGTSKDRTGAVNTAIAFTPSELDPFVKHVSYHMPVRAHTTASGAAYTDQIIHLEGNGLGGFCTIENAGTGDGNTWIMRNAIIDVTDPDPYVPAEHVCGYRNKDSDYRSSHYGYGQILCGHRAIPAEVLQLLGGTAHLNEGAYVEMRLVKRTGHNRAHGKKYQGRRPGGQTQSKYGKLYNHRGNKELNYLNCSVDNVDVLELRKSYYFNPNYDYRSSNIYELDSNLVHIRAKENIPEDTDIYDDMNSSLVLPNYVGTQQLGLVMPGKQMSIVNGGASYLGGDQGDGAFGVGASPCCPCLTGIDFYGAPYDIQNISSPTGNGSGFVYGGNGHKSDDWMSCDGSNTQDGNWCDINTGQSAVPKGFRTCYAPVNPNIDETTLMMLCPIYPIAAYEFYRKCYNGGERIYQGDGQNAGFGCLGYDGSERHPSYERFYYTVAICLIDSSGANIIDYFVDSPRYIDKDEMPRKDNTGQIDGVATNKLWQDHVFIVTNQVKVQQIYPFDVPCIVRATLDTSHIAFGITHGIDGQEYGFPTGAPIGPGTSPCQGPWHLRFAYCGGSDGGKLVGYYADGHLGQSSSDLTHHPFPIRDNNSDLEAIYAQMGPKWGDES